MKFVFGLTLLMILFAFQTKEKIRFNIVGNPSCLVRKSTYTLMAKINNPKAEEYIVLSGIGVSLTKSKDDWRVYVPSSKSEKTVKIIVGIKNSRTKKIKSCGQYVFDLCDE